MWKSWLGLITHQLKEWKKQLKLAAWSVLALIKPKCLYVWKKKGEKIDHAIWIKHKWTYTQSGRQKREKKSYKSQSLETGNKRARLHEQRQTATSATSSFDCFHFSGALFGFGHRMRYANNSNSVFESLDGYTDSMLPQLTQMPDSNFNIRLADINAHTTHAANEQKSRECVVWEKKAIESAERDGRWSMPQPNSAQFAS